MGPYTALPLVRRREPIKGQYKPPLELTSCSADCLPTQAGGLVVNIKACFVMTKKIQLVLLMLNDEML